MSDLVIYERTVLGGDGEKSSSWMWRVYKIISSQDLYQIGVGNFSLISFSTRSSCSCYKKTYDFSSYSKVFQSINIFLRWHLLDDLFSQTISLFRLLSSFSDRVQQSYQHQHHHSDGRDIILHLCPSRCQRLLTEKKFQRQNCQHRFVKCTIGRVIVFSVTRYWTKWYRKFVYGYPK